MASEDDALLSRTDHWLRFWKFTQNVYRSFQYKVQDDQNSSPISATCITRQFTMEKRLNSAVEAMLLNRAASNKFQCTEFCFCFFKSLPGRFKKMLRGGFLFASIAHRYYKIKVNTFKFNYD